jgi:rubrerythrin
MANEKRLIDAWKLVIDLERIKKCGEYDHEDVLAVIASQKTVDTVEVVHGRWVKKTEDYVYYYACSECGEPVLKSQWGHDFFSDYCPNCGAMMDGGNEHV